jgi:hypothetical protein
MAGAKAGYERFYSVMGAQPSYPWDELTQERQDFWIQIIKAACKEMQRVQSRRATRRLLYPLAAR